MRFTKNFELVDVANEYMIIPVGETADTFKGLVVLNEASGYLLSHMRTDGNDISFDELVECLQSRYPISYEQASRDIAELLEKLLKFGILSE